METNNARTPNSPAASSSTSTNGGQRDYFDFQATGLAYINDVRWVTPNGKGRRTKFLAARLSALQGKPDEVQYVHLNVNIFGPKLIELLSSYADMGRDQPRLLARVKVSDFALNTYVRTKGEDKGTIVPVLYGRLFAVPMLKVDGVEVHRDVRPAAVADGTNGPAPEASAQAAPSAQRTAPADVVDFNDDDTPY